MNFFWKDIYGHDLIKEALLKLAFSKREPHSFLFVGPDGIGKFAIAVRYAQISSIGLIDEKSFFSSHIFEKISNLEEPRIKLVLPTSVPSSDSADDESSKKKNSNDALIEEIQLKIKNPYSAFLNQGSKTIRIDTIRDVIKFVSYKYEEINKRFILIPNADLMNIEAQNSLLKTLEEPPDDTYFILMTSRLNQILDTIKSRCRIFYFSPLKKEDIERILHKYYKVTHDNASILAEFSEGSIREAEKLLDVEISTVKTNCINFLRNVFSAKFYSSLKIVNENFSASQNKDEFKFFLKMLSFWFRAAQKNKIGLDDEKFKEEKEIFVKFNDKYKNFNFLKVLSLIDNYISQIDKNVNVNVILNNLCWELYLIEK